MASEDRLHHKHAMIAFSGLHNYAIDIIIRNEGKGMGCFVNFSHKTKKGILLGICEGPCNDELSITYEEALRGWVNSDYVLVEARHGYVVNGGLHSGPARASESFGQANAFLYFNERLRRFELRLAGNVKPGLYEILINYTKPNCPSAYYWTAH